MVIAPLLISYGKDIETTVGFFLLLCRSRQAESVPLRWWEAEGAVLSLVPRKWKCVAAQWHQNLVLEFGPWL